MFPYSQMLFCSCRLFTLTHQCKTAFVFHHVDALDVISEYYLCTLFLHFEFKHVSFLRQCYSALLWLSQPEKKLTFNHADQPPSSVCFVASRWQHLKRSLFDQNAALWNEICWEHLICACIVWLLPLACFWFSQLVCLRESRSDD